MGLKGRRFEVSKEVSQKLSLMWAVMLPGIEMASVILEPVPLITTASTLNGSAVLCGADDQS
jgi:hypothetical protein